MFTTQHPWLRKRAARVGAAVTVLAAAGALTLTGPLSATAADTATSYGEGTFLSGTLLGMSLDNVAALEGASATNDGTQTTQTEKDPFKAEVLNTIQVGTGSPVQVGDLGDVVQTGIPSQYATASSNGSSMAASGAVGSDGAIGVGADQSAPGGATTVDLTNLLNGKFASTITNLKLNLQAIAAQAQGDTHTTSGSYSIAGATLTFTSPAISKLTQKVDDSLSVVNSKLDALGGSDGQLTDLVNGLLGKVSPALTAVGADAHVNASIDAGDLVKKVNDALNEQYGDQGISFNLENGQVTVDLAKYVGGLNNLPANSELLTDQNVEKILNSITDTVSHVSDQVLAKVKDLLNQANVNVSATVKDDVAQAPIVKKVCEVVQHVIDVPVPGSGSSSGGSDSGSGGLGGLGGVVGGIVGGVDNTVDNVVNGVTDTVQQVVNETVCHNETTTPSPLETKLSLDIAGTVNQLINGSGASADATLTLPTGVKTNVDLGTTLNGIGDLLNSSLFSGGAITDLQQQLDSHLVNPAVTGLLGSQSSVEQLLTQLLSITVNNKSTQTVAVTPSPQALGSTGGFGGHAGAARVAADPQAADATGTEFTETAVRVTAAPGLGSPATINLASATVGPNVSQGVLGDGGDNGGGDNGGGGTGGGGNGGGVLGDGGSLAFTGVGIAMLIIVILALLAAGAYMVRESYRRNRPPAGL